MSRLALPNGWVRHWRPRIDAPWDVDQAARRRRWVIDYPIVQVVAESDRMLVHLRQVSTLSGDHQGTSATCTRADIKVMVSPELLSFSLPRLVYMQDTVAYVMPLTTLTCRRC